MNTLLNYNISTIFALLTFYSKVEINKFLFFTSIFSNECTKNLYRRG